VMRMADAFEHDELCVGKHLSQRACMNVG
jgi:hypothetical protein